MNLKKRIERKRRWHKRRKRINFMFDVGRCEAMIIKELSKRNIFQICYNRHDMTFDNLYSLSRSYNVSCVRYISRYGKFESTVRYEESYRVITFSI